MSETDLPCPAPAVMAAECEFCTEFCDHESSRFYSRYRHRADSRIIARADGLVALPTLGQIFECSLLVLPEAHHETMAQVYQQMGESLTSFVAETGRRVRHVNRPVVFEHGARCETGGSCGIYHAHLHVVPVPGDVSCDDLLPAANIKWLPSLGDAWAALAGSSEYLLFRGTDGRVGVHDASPSPRRFGSQYFRRALVRHFGAERPWDWRSYDEVEPDVLRALRLTCDVPVG